MWVKITTIFLHHGTYMAEMKSLQDTNKQEYTKW